MSVSVIERTINAAPCCPKCGCADLVVVAVETKRRPQHISDGRGAAEFIGYDCRMCGENLRFDTKDGQK